MNKISSTNTSNNNQMEKPVLVETIDNVNLWLLDLESIKSDLCFSAFLLANPQIEHS